MDLTTTAEPIPLAVVRHFVVADYVVFALVLAISVAIGIFYACTGGKQKTTSEFLMADRSMSVLPVSMSLLASFMSAITLLGTPSEIYVYGTQYWMIWIGYVLMIPVAAHVTIPVFFRLGITSVFEYLELRFNMALRLSCSIIYVVQMVLYMAIVLYAPSLALEAVTGLDVKISVFTLGIVCTFYTTLGGMKAVMWTDTFQIVIMFIGLIAVLVKGSMDLGGFTKIWQDLEDGERVEFWNFDPDPRTRHTMWNLVFGGATTWLAIYGVNQAQIQRTLTVPKLRSAQIAMWINLVGLTALLTVCALAGVVVYSHYKGCDPLSTKQIHARDQLLPLYVMHVLGDFPGLPGLFTASLFCGTLSTISSGLNSLAAVTLEDIVKKCCFRDISDAKATWISKGMAMSFGVLCIALTFVAALLGGVLQAALAIFGMLGGPQLGVFLLGMVFPCANGKGGLAGFFTGLIFTLWIGIGAQVYKPVNTRVPPVSVDDCLYYNVTLTSPADKDYGSGYLEIYGISYMWYSAISIITVTIVGLVVSVATGSNKSSDVDSKLLSPVFDVFCCCLPERLRQYLRCQVEYTEDDETEKNDIAVEAKEEPMFMNGGVDNPAQTTPVVLLSMTKL